MEVSIDLQRLPTYEMPFSPLLIFKREDER
jgi:hypothetical protein